MPEPHAGDTLLNADTAFTCRASSSLRLHKPRHLPCSASSTINCRGCGKLKGDNCRLIERHPPVGISSFSATATCVVASKKPESLRLKVVSAALMSRKER